MPTPDSVATPLAQLKRRARVPLPFCAAALLAGCVYFPKDGPLRSEIGEEAQAPKGTPFALVEVSGDTLGAIAGAGDPGFAASFGDAPATEPRLGIGDGVSLVVFEAGSEPLFGGAAGAGAGPRGVPLPERLVGLDGGIDVPYAGHIAAAGRTVRELEQAVEHALTGRAAQPQVTVSLTRSAGSAVTVLGEVGAGARVPLSSRGERLLDALAASGGLRGSTFDTWVELDRDGRAVREPLARLLREPQENLRLRAGDTIVVTHHPETFTVFGATGRSAQIEFGAESVTLAEAMAKSGGLQDSRADPRGVFLFRYEPEAVAAKLGAKQLVGPKGAAVVYQFDFLRASAYFLSQQFVLRDRDVLYVASAPVNELQKFLQLIGLLTQPALSGFAVENSIK